MSDANQPTLDPVRPAFVVGGLFTLVSGIPWIMRDLAAALARAGSPVTVYAAHCFGKESVGHIFERPNRWVSTRGFWLGGLSWAPLMRSILRRAVEEADIVHNHTLWMLPTAISSVEAHRARIPTVITAHGALEPWAVEHSRWKKKLAGWAFQDFALRVANCIHVNSRAEIAGVRQYGLKSPIAVIPNGIHPPDFAKLPDQEAFGLSHPAVRGRKIILWLGRMHKKKGLDHLVRAWSGLASKFKDWVLVLGGTEDGFGEQTRALAKDLCPIGSVYMPGQLNGTQKLAALSAASFFVYPSFSEGFSMAILEAMACRLPVLTTPGCNFKEAFDAGAAVEVEPTVESTEAGLLSLLSQDAEERREMGERGFGLIERRYNWDRVASQTLELYSWLIGRSHMPEFVVRGD